MAIEYVCSWCGFILYRGTKIKSIDDIAKYWGGFCPSCMSPLSRVPHKIVVRHAKRLRQI